MTVRALARWRWWIAAAAAVTGVLVGLLVAFTVSTDRRAEAVVRISGPGAEGLLPDLRQLATSSVLAGNVTSTLRLHESPGDVRNRLSASIRPHTRLLAIRARASSADRARQLAQEAAVVFTQIAPARFPNVKAQLFDAAHGIGGGDRHVLRDCALGLLVGLCIGLLAAALLGGGTVAPGDLDERERLLARRVELVSRREVAIARRVGELAASERRLGEREPEPASEAAPIPAPDPEPAPTPVPVAGHFGLNLRDLERFVAAQSDVEPGRREEWEAYLFFLRDHAAADGSLPENFAPLIDEVFRS